MHEVSILLIVGLATTLLMSVALRLMNLAHMKSHAHVIPPGFEAALDPHTLQRMSSYGEDSAKLALIKDFCSQGLVILIVAAGYLGAYERWILSLSSSFVVQGTLFVLVASWLLSLLHLPFDIYENFVVEARHGFNHSGLQLFWADFLKGRLVVSVLLGVLCAGGLSLIQWSGPLWWLTVWGFLFGFQLLITMLAPKVIEPLFFKMTPVTEGELSERIVSLVSSVGVRVEKIFQMDASRRSGHTNAYFSGFGPVKRVVLFDTLLSRLAVDEIVAVLAHELGHWKRKHILRRVAVGQLESLGACFGAYLLVTWHALPQLVFEAEGSFFLRLTVVLLIGSVLGFLLEPVGSWWSRKHEWEADQFATAHVPAESLQRALIKLSTDNLTNLNMHPIYAAWHASHPTMPERVARLAEAASGNAG